MADGKNGLKASAAFLASGIAAGGLALLLKNEDVARFVADLAQTDTQLLTKGVSWMAGLYSIGATGAGAFMAPYYAVKCGYEKIFGK